MPDEHLVLLDDIQALFGLVGIYCILQSMDYVAALHLSNCVRVFE